MKSQVHCKIQKLKMNNYKMNMIKHRKVAKLKLIN